MLGPRVLRQRKSGIPMRRRSVMSRKQREEDEEILSHFVRRDPETGYYILTAEYQRYSDLFPTNQGPGMRSIMSQDYAERIYRMSELIPDESGMLLTIKVDDKEGRTAEQIKEDIFENLRLARSLYGRRVREQNIWCWSLTLSGAAVLGANLIYSVVSGGNNPVMSEIIDIIGTVMVWEAVTLYFVEKRGDSKKLRTHKRKIKGISVE